MISALNFKPFERPGMTSHFKKYQTERKMSRMKKLFFTLIVNFLILIPAISLANNQQLLKVLQMYNARGTSSCAGTYGRTTGSTLVHPTANNRAYLTKVTLNCSASSGYIVAVLGNINPSDQRCIFVIYDDDGGNGEPGTLLMQYLLDDTIYDGIYPAPFTANVSGVVWVGIIFENTNSYYYQEATGGEGRIITLGSFAAPATWDAVNDSHSTVDRAFYLSF